MGRLGAKTREVRPREDDDGYIRRRMPMMELSGKRTRGRPKMRCMDQEREDMAVVEVTEDDAEGRTKWRWKIRRDAP